MPAPCWHSPASAWPPPVRLGSARYSRKGNRDSWYRDPDKPKCTPPEAMFPVVETSLDALIAWSGWRIWSAASCRERQCRPATLDFATCRQRLMVETIADRCPNSPWPIFSCWKPCLRPTSRRLARSIQRRMSSSHTETGSPSPPFGMLKSLAAILRKANPRSWRTVPVFLRVGTAP